MPLPDISGRMGRGEELSEFQRGTVVGCHLCKKSVREISALLNLPRSTVSSVILRWKRGGITTALPRSGRPHKLKEEHRQLLERVALQKCLPSIKAIAAEFQTTSGASVSCSTVRRELHEMGFRGPLSSNYKHKAKMSLTSARQRVGKKKAALRQEDIPVDVSRLDLRVGRILTAVQLPDTDRLYMQLELGEVIPRTVVSELAKHVPADQVRCDHG